MRNYINILDSSTTIEYCRRCLLFKVIIHRLLILATYVPLPRISLINVPSEYSMSAQSRLLFIIVFFQFSNPGNRKGIAFSLVRPTHLWRHFYSLGWVNRPWSTRFLARRRRLSDRQFVTTWVADTLYRWLKAIKPEKQTSIGNLGLHKTTDSFCMIVKDLNQARVTTTMSRRISYNPERANLTSAINFMQSGMLPALSK